MSGLRFEQSYTVTWGDCDAAGIVFYPRYYALFDANSHAMFREAGLSHHALRKRFGALGMPLADTGATFRAALTYDDEVTLVSEVAKLGRSSVRVLHQVLRAGSVAVDGHETRVWCIADAEHPGRLKSAPLPEEVRALLQPAASLTD